MADENGDRATVALVSAKIDGLRELLNSRLGGIEKRLDDLSNLPVTVAKVEGDVKVHDLRLDSLEQRNRVDTEWKRGPALAVAVAVVVAILNLLFGTGVVHFG